MCLKATKLIEESDFSGQAQADPLGPRKQLPKGRPHRHNQCLRNISIYCQQTSGLGSGGLEKAFWYPESEREELRRGKKMLSFTCLRVCSRMLPALPYVSHFFSVCTERPEARVLCLHSLRAAPSEPRTYHLLWLDSGMDSSVQVILLSQASWLTHPQYCVFLFPPLSVSSIALTFDPTFQCTTLNIVTSYDEP